MQAYSTAPTTALPRAVVRQRGELIGTALRRLSAAYPAVVDYDQRQRDATAEDMGHAVDFLSAALYVG